MIQQHSLELMEQENSQARAGNSRSSQLLELEDSPVQKITKSNDRDDEHEDDNDNDNDNDELDDNHPDATLREEQRLERDYAEEEQPALEAFDWQGLESRFKQEMDAQTEEETRIQAEFSKLMNFYMIWQRTPVVQEQDRCSKRLRTRIAYVEMREQDLEAKRHHHQQVKKAFESALELLKQQFRA